MNARADLFFIFTVSQKVGRMIRGQNDGRELMRNSSLFCPAEFEVTNGTNGRNRSQNRRITFDYVMLDGINDSDADARELTRLLDGIHAKVNLIPWNP